MLMSLVPNEVNLNPEGNKNQFPKGASPDEEKQAELVAPS